MSAAKLCRDKFQGCLIGALIGDCLGAPFEGAPERISREKILKKIHPDALVNKPIESMQFTDDTAMMRSVCSSLLHCKKFDAVDMATRFTNEYFREKNRGYGFDVTKVFNYWNENQITLDNVFKPASKQFDGSGSYGNGAAMRVAPVALLATMTEECIHFAKKSGLLTHSNRHGYMGAILQALGVYKVLYANGKIDAFKFLHELKSEISRLENDLKDDDKKEMTKSKEETSNSSDCDLDEEGKLHEWTKSASFSYTKQLEVIEELLKLHQQNVKEDDTLCVINRLGRSVLAQQAVPTALYCFLRNLDLGFEETLYYAISLGGDTDTIGAMCAAIAGAYYGYSKIPSVWTVACESCKEMKCFADGFSDIHSNS